MHIGALFNENWEFVEMSLVSDLAQAKMPDNRQDECAHKKLRRGIRPAWLRSVGHISLWSCKQSVTPVQWKFTRSGWSIFDVWCSIWMHLVTLMNKTFKVNDRYILVNGLVCHIPHNRDASHIISWRDSALQVGDLGSFRRWLWGKTAFLLSTLEPKAVFSRPLCPLQISRIPKWCHIDRPHEWSCFWQLCDLNSGSQPNFEFWSYYCSRLHSESGKSFEALAKYTAVQHSYQQNTLKAFVCLGWSPQVRDLPDSTVVYYSQLAFYFVHGKTSHWDGEEQTCLKFLKIAMASLAGRSFSCGKEACEMEVVCFADSFLINQRTMVENTSQTRARGRRAQASPTDLYWDNGRLGGCREAQVRGQGWDVPSEHARKKTCRGDGMLGRQSQQPQTPSCLKWWPFKENQAWNRWQVATESRELDIAKLRRMNKKIQKVPIPTWNNLLVKEWGRWDNYVASGCCDYNFLMPWLPGHVSGNNLEASF